MIAKNKKHLAILIHREINENGFECDLNHIDVSNIYNMNGLFKYSQFNGDISQWDVSKVEDMSYMFLNCAFNGDISQWNVSSVENMSEMFEESRFNQDISNWNISNVKLMDNIFYQCEIVKPYWAQIDDVEQRQQAVKIYQQRLALKNQLEHNLKTNGHEMSKNKI